MKFQKNTWNLKKILLILWKYSKKHKKYFNFCVLVKRNKINILIIWISLIQNTWIYCSTWDSIAALGLRPRCCNTVPRAAINPRILNAWNSNYKYLYSTFLKHILTLFIVIYHNIFSVHQMKTQRQLVWNIAVVVEGKSHYNLKQLWRRQNSSSWFKIWSALDGLKKMKKIATGMNFGH